MSALHTYQYIAPLPPTRANMRLLQEFDTAKCQMPHSTASLACKILGPSVTMGIWHVALKIAFTVFRHLMAYSQMPHSGAMV